MCRPGILFNCARHFARDRKGNVAIMFSLALPVLLIAGGAAVDYSRAASARSAMQHAADSAALMVSKEASNLSESEAHVEWRIEVLDDRSSLLYSLRLNTTTHS